MTTDQQSARRSFSSIGITFAFLTLGSGGGAWAQSASLFITNTAQPPNVGDAIIATAAYKESGAYDRDVAAVAQQAADWIGERAPSVPRPALVLDIDETALSNWEVITRDNFGRAGAPAEEIAANKCAAELLKVAPAGSSYLSESDFFEGNWKHPADHGITPIPWPSLAGRGPTSSQRRKLPAKPIRRSAR